ncbi:hypothetical protein A2130_00530 [Candidatus Woesebacteria bacterium GWC2_33_12]|uniref:Uncharacterized protein n=1 Tax=Candidatus Woesebacteria bacterium GW2011_GWB1_33_22 TaxID=1618566 RepID=A0A0F9ZYF4_9BACT|nr:MAG: hypothetical protein UR29_C0008G0051 [Candidatus Woesebacteria bacterium GW2011_GWC2_33_12]KKP41553.1 MAG: hypothetical protein UR33_C0013G0031 [Candidatus Woesebacteria bacterium GW2011_GWA2_33_20]KKP44006.1 MAG: hypothetical protein UR35_C0013G0031 [Candidatus Woesebacteria bacterium GW2011_GWB1_33_22]KKP46553.1 MAG: hypothetical protein UR37_C0006G0003 [Microgenomates group bacterium GW2011_GWC1_33_28]KKP49484.1 MAG: hypothetical protein UR41_C0014G0031 [Candidatus Woesebacteria bact
MILSLTLWSILKVFILIFLVIYIIFAFVVMRQVQLMTATLEVGFEGQLKFLAFLHFLFAIAVFVFAILIL